jgi:3-phytase
VVRRVDTPPVHQYDDAPRTPDSDDPSIWINPKKKGEALVITALKEAGLQVFDLQGNVVQTIIPPNSPPVSALDPPTVGPHPHPGTSACPESEEGETFGRFNNVDVQYDFEIRDARGKKQKVDIAVVSDRGCDRVRIYQIDPGRAGGPLFDITDPGIARVFPQRWVNPWNLVSNPAPSVEDNPLDDESTVYGLTLYKHKHKGLRAFVTQAAASVVAELELYGSGNGKVSYRRVREFRFNPVFTLPKASGGTFQWSPCREDEAENPQFEGLVVDQENAVLYAAQETVGIWKLDLNSASGSVVNVPAARLIEPVKSFAQAYWAVPDDGEFSCEDEAPEEAAEGTLVQAGNPALAGANLEADAEGLALYYGSCDDEGYLIASSQGDDSFHVYKRKGGFTRATANQHLDSFHIEDGGETDGHDVVNVPAGAGFPKGLFVAQSGNAPEPENTDDINGYEYDGSTQFLLLGWEDIAGPLHLTVDTRGYDPRKPKQ